MGQPPIPRALEAAHSLNVIQVFLDIRITILVPIQVGIGWIVRIQMMFDQ